MINFDSIQLDRLCSFLSSLSGNTDSTQYFDVGRMIEIAYEEYSNGQLKRLTNNKGKDLVDLDGKTYESKKVTFKNKNKCSVRNIIVLNFYGNADIAKFTPADYYIFTDPDAGKACCVPGNLLRNIKQRGSTVTADCDPEQSNFFLNCSMQSSINYFDLKQKFIIDFIKNF